MREILFRGKAVGSGMWVCGQYRKTAKLDLIYPFDDRDDCLAVYPETVGQFTGALDKDGRKIFEGDILEWAAIDEAGWGPAIRGYVDYDEKEFAWRVNWQRYDPDWLADLHIPAVSIVGNIHDNPELVGVE